MNCRAREQQPSSVSQCLAAVHQQCCSGILRPHNSSKACWGDNSFIRWMQCRCVGSASLLWQAVSPTGSVPQNTFPTPLASSAQNQQQLHYSSLCSRLILISQIGSICKAYYTNTSKQAHRYTLDLLSCVARMTPSCPMSICRLLVTS